MQTVYRITGNFGGEFFVVFMVESLSTDIYQRMKWMKSTIISIHAVQAATKLIMVVSTN